MPVLNRECASVSVVVVRAMQRDARAEVTHVSKASVGTLDLLVCREAESRSDGSAPFDRRVLIAGNSER